MPSSEQYGEGEVKINPFLKYSVADPCNFGTDPDADPCNFGTDPDADPDPRIRTSDYLIQMRILEAQKHTDPTDPEHWYIYIILQR